VKRIFLALIAALILAGSLPALAAFSLRVPLVAADPGLASTSSFPTAAVAKLDWDSTNAQSASEPASVSVVTDGSFVYVRFDVPQREQIIGFEGGDNVAVDLLPNGQSGDVYHFAVSPSGARSTSSSANTAEWGSSGSTHAGGYSVTMKIPKSAFGGTNTLQAQFTRFIASTGELQVWAHGGSDIAQTGTLSFASAVGTTGTSAQP
jgi:hypothetical protein